MFFVWRLYPLFFVSKRLFTFIKKKKSGILLHHICVIILYSSMFSLWRENFIWYFQSLVLICSASSVMCWSIFQQTAGWTLDWILEIFVVLLSLLCVAIFWWSLGISRLASTNVCIYIFRLYVYQIFGTFAYVSLLFEHVWYTWILNINSILHLWHEVNTLQSTMELIRAA